MLLMLTMTLTGNDRQPNGTCEQTDPARVGRDIHRVCSVVARVLCAGLRQASPGQRLLEHALAVPRRKGSFFHRYGVVAIEES